MPNHGKNTDVGEWDGILVIQRRQRLRYARIIYQYGDAARLTLSIMEIAKSKQVGAYC